MRKLHLYIIGGLMLFTQMALAQKVEWGDYSRNQAGLQVKLKEKAAGSGIQVILSTTDEEAPAWVPDKGKGCDMILSDASKLAGCKVIESPGVKKLSFTHKSPNNISTASLQYIFDMESCTGSHTILINYAVGCKKGEGTSGQIKIPFHIKPPVDTVDPIASSQTSKQEDKPDTTNQQVATPGQNNNPPNQVKPKTHPSDQAGTTSSNSATPGNTHPDRISETQTEPEVTETTPSTFSQSSHTPRTKPEETPPPPQNKKKTSFPFYLLFILLAVGIIGWFLYTRNKKQASPPPPVRQPKPAPKPLKKQSSIGLKAIPRPKKSGDYTIVNLHHCWEDSSIHQVFLNQQLMQELNEFITDQNLKPFHEDGSDSVPEIGGFILGQYKHAGKEGEWDVYLEKFKAITPGKSGVYRVSFETMAWAELAEIQDQYPALQTLAWFHTHPGHGLFLSQPDLRIHNGFFKEKYQLAMEIDTLSEGLDTAFFSRKKSGKVNNRQDRASNRWFKWEKLMKLQQTS